MEQAKCLLWVKSKHKRMQDHHHITPSKIMKKFEYDPYLSRKDHNRQEGVEFGDTVAAGGCIWPPRSYACSFCKREFKSAQALGGHMNVHRRDRALLKQVLTHKSNNDSIFLPYSTSNHHRNLMISSSKSLLAQSCSYNHPTHVSPLLSKPCSKSSQKFCDYVSSRKVIDMSANKEIKKACGEEYLSNKRCKKSGGDCATLLPFFDEVKCSNVKDKGVMMKINEVLSVGVTNKSMDDHLDLELRLGTLTQKVK